MNPLLRLSAAALVLAGLGSCHAPRYRLDLRDGREIVAAGRPEYVAKTGYYRYRSPEGKDALVRADEVVRLHEQ